MIDFLGPGKKETLAKSLPRGLGRPQDVAEAVLLKKGESK
jgi:hypothetical protein